MDLKHVGRQRDDDAAKTLPQTNAMVRSCIIINRMNLMTYKALKTLGLCLKTILWTAVGSSARTQDEKTLDLPL